MKRGGLAVCAGLIAILACVWALFVWLAAPYLQSVSVLKPLPVLAGLVVAIPLSVFAGIYWTKLLFGITVLAAALLIYVGLRIH
jgi:hypothetical protein